MISNFLKSEIILDFCEYQVVNTLATSLFGPNQK